MKNLSTKLTLISLLFGLSLTLSFCGEKEQPKEEPAKTETTEPAKTEETKPATGDNSKLVSEYETLVNSFCTNVDKAKSADKATQATMAIELAKTQTSVTETAAKVAKVRDSLAETDKAKVAELDKKGIECGKKLAGMSSAPTPSTKDVNKKVDDLKKKVPGF
ncbi:MAG: hypothetical protein H7A25_25550 [Leptospiraceae bacterium]|nr:hypothetical protein [Leptospiraceae bacterium]MCP5503289.1 hypothetical protein [Leptospiraceae bacterium]